VSVNPAGPTIVYDGDCGFCQRWVDRFKRWERGDQVALMRLQDEDAPRITGKSREELHRAMCLVLPDDRVFSGADAAREVMRYARLGWLARLGFALPGAMWVSRRVYAAVAARRRELGCGGDHCTLPVAGHDGAA
jgi:lipase maturation factor 1